MDPITLGLIATGALGKIGSLFGPKRKQLDPNMLKQLFGAKAITDEQMELFNRVINSAQGMQLMTGAAQQGQQFQTDVARNMANAGLGPAGGASGGADIFAGAASESAVGNLQRSMRANLMEAMLPIAQQLVSDRMQAWLTDREKTLGQTSRFQDIMGAVGGLSSDLLASRQASQSSAGQPSNQGPAPGTTMGSSGWQYPMAGQPAGNMPAISAAPAGTQPAGTAAVGSSLAMPNMMLQGSDRIQKLRTLLNSGGRFARAMTSTNRFGTVQPAGAF